MNSPPRVSAMSIERAKSTVAAITVWRACVRHQSSPRVYCSRTHSKARLRRSTTPRRIAHAQSAGTTVSVRTSAPRSA